MTNQEISSEILSAMGGSKNISTVSHCATRLRIKVHDENDVHEEQVKAIVGVMGLVKNLKEYQVIIGTNVGSVHQEFQKLGNFTTGKFLADKKVKQEDNRPMLDTKPKQKLFLTATDFIAGSVLPALPVIVAGGMISAVLVILTTFFGLSKETGTYTVLDSVYQAAFGFLPVFVGYNTATKLNISPILGALLGAVLVSSGINGVEGLSFLGIPMATVSYSSSILPVIFGVLFMMLPYKFLDKYTPKEISFFIVPLVTMLITVPVTLVAIGPIATWAGALIGKALVLLNTHLGWLSVGVLGLVCALLLFTGTASGLYAVIFVAFAENGFENFVMPAMLASNLAVGGAAIAAMTMLKNKDTKAIALSSGLTAVFGITEPAIFGVLARFKRPFIGAAIGGAIGGLFAGFVHLAEFAFVSPGVASIIAFINPNGTSTNFIMAIITMIIGFSTSFIATKLLGIDEEGSI